MIHGGESGNCLREVAQKIRGARPKLAKRPMWRFAGDDSLRFIWSPLGSHFTRTGPSHQRSHEPGTGQRGLLSSTSSEGKKEAVLHFLSFMWQYEENLSRARTNIFQFDERNVIAAAASTNSHYLFLL